MWFARVCFVVVELFLLAFDQDKKRNSQEADDIIQKRFTLTKTTPFSKGNHKENGNFQIGENILKLIV